MSIALTVNGQTFNYPEPGDQNWGPDATEWATSVTSGMLQKAGGLFQLLNEVDFGTTHGLKSLYYTSRSSNLASSGQLRLARTDVINWRNEANSSNLSLSVNSTNELLFNGSKLALSGNIVNADISPSAAISLSKLAAVTASRVLVSDPSGVITASTVTSTSLGYLDATSSIQTQLNAKLNLSGGTMAGTLNMGSQSITNLLDPVNPQDGATKNYVDNAIQGLNSKAAVRVATTTAGTLASSFENGDTVDGVVLATGNRILIKNQASQAENGIYLVNASGAPTRSSDANTWPELISAYVFVEEGTSNADSGWICTVNAGGTLGVTAVTFVQFSQAGVITTDGEGIEKTGTVLSLELDGSTLSKSSTGLKVSDATIAILNGKLDNVLTTQGDIIYSASGSTPTRLPIGTAGQVLTAFPFSVLAWATPTIINPTVTSVAGTLNLVAGDSNKIFLISTTAARTVNLPAPASGLVFRFKDSTGQANTNNITLVRTGSENIEGVAASKILQTNWGSWTLVSDGTNWFLI